MKNLFVLLVAVVFPLAAQTVVERRPYVRASGEGSVAVRPDQAKVSVGVITQGATAEEASEQNSAIAGKVINDVRTALGNFAEVRTISISVTPNYRQTSPPQNPPVISSYTATNTVQITLSDVTLAGKAIDTATKAGANSIYGVQFGLKDSSSSRQQALRLATAQARLQAEAIATGLGARIGRVLAAVEGSVVVPYASVRDTTGIAAAVTPVETGTLDIRATVTIEAEILN